MTAAWRALRKHFWTALLFDAVAIILVFVAISAWQTRNLPNDENTPSLQAVWLDDKVAGQVLQSGQTGVVYFFAPWCGICRSSISNLDELVENGDIAWARVVALDYSSVDEVRQFISETDVSLPVVLGSPETSRDWQIRGFPTYFVIDADGKIVSRSVGYSTKLGLKARAWLNES
jgi:thiol-disulfide isomerase/thioredoxin